MEPALREQVYRFLAPDRDGREPVLEDYSGTTRKLTILQRIDEDHFRKLPDDTFTLVAITVYGTGVITLISMTQREDLEPDCAEYQAIREWVDLTRAQERLEQ